MGLSTRQIMEQRAAAPGSAAYRTIGDKTFSAAASRKWARLLEGVNDPMRREVTAILAENQMDHLTQGAGMLSEETRSQSAGGFTKYIFPVLRRVFPNLIAHDLVSVQPLTAPIGAIFYLDFLYGTTKGQTTQGNIFPKDFDRDYSSEYVNGEILATGDGTNFGGAGTAFSAVLNFSPVRPLNTANGYKLLIQEENSSGTAVQTAIDNGSGSFTFVPASGAGTPGGTINYSNGSINAFKFANVPTLSNKIKAYYFYDGEFSSKIPQVQLDVKQAPVVAKPRRLKALWSAEAMEDLRAFQGLDAETEMVAAVAMNIALEIDREIINDLLLASTETSDSFDRAVPGAISEHDHLKALITTLSSVSALISKKTLRAPANWIVTSPEVSALFSSLTTHGDFNRLFSSDMSTPHGAVDEPRPLTTHGQFGIYKMGSLLGKWSVYVDPFMTRDMCLLGLKGQTYLDAGFVFAPYIPLQVTPLFMDPNDFSYRKGMRTRYASKMTRKEFYGQVRILNM